MSGPKSAARVPGTDAARAPALVMLAACTGGMLLFPGEAELPLTVAFALAVQRGAALEQRPLFALTWALASGVMVAAVGWRHGVLFGVAMPSPPALGLVGVTTAIFLAIAIEANRMRRLWNDATVTSQVARAKLLRSNDELTRSITEARRALGKLGTIVDELVDGLLAVSAEGTLELANPALCKLLGRDLAPGVALADAGLPDPLREHISARIAAGDVASVDLRLEGRVVSATGSPVRVQGELWGVVVIVRDVTLQREIDRIKSDFIATVSHEMRTPLTTVLGFARVSQKKLEREVLPAIGGAGDKTQRTVSQVRDNLQIISVEAERLARIIANVLDLSKMQSGQMEWRMGECSPHALAERASGELAARFAEKAGVALEVSVPERLAPVHADADAIVRVLANLLENGLKFTEAGHVRLTAESDAENVTFRVEDTGVGIHRANQDAVFERFLQVGDVLTDRPGGAGLGLALCREILRQHGGRIWVSSERGRGSTFGFSLRRADVPPASDAGGDALA